MVGLYLLLELWFNHIYHSLVRSLIKLPCWYILTLTISSFFLLLYYISDAYTLWLQVFNIASMCLACNISIYLYKVIAMKKNGENL